MIVALRAAVLYIVHIATAKGSATAKQSAAATPAEGDTAAYLGTRNLIIRGGMALTIAVRADKLY